jgi:hypothetical protein
VAGSPRSDDDKAGTPLAGLSCSCWVLHKPIEKSSAWGQKTPYYNRPTQDGLRGHFVLRAIGKRFRKDRTAGCEKVVGIRFALDSSLEEGGFEPSVPLQNRSPCKGVGPVAGNCRDVLPVPEMPQFDAPGMPRSASR